MALNQEFWLQQKRREAGLLQLPSGESILQQATTCGTCVTVERFSSSNIF